VKLNKNLVRILSLSLSLLFVLSTSANASTIADRTDNRKNIAPDASFDVIKKSPIDVVVFTDYQGQKLVDLQSKFTDFKIGLSKNSDVQVKYIDNDSSKVSIGRRMEAVLTNYYAIKGTATGTMREDHDSSNGPSTSETYTVAASFNLDGTYSLPWETQPLSYSVNILPSSVTRRADLIYEHDSGSTWSYTHHYNSYIYTVPGHTGSWEYMYHSDRSSNDSSGSTDRTFLSGPTFAFNNKFGFLNTRETGKIYNADVRGWDLSNNLAALGLRDNANTVVVFACDNNSTMYYTQGGYNVDNINSFKLCDLRADNLGNLVRDKGAAVYSISGTEVDGLNVAGHWEDGYTDDGDGGSNPYHIFVNNWSTFLSTDATKRQDLSISELINKYSAKGKSLAQGDAAGLIDILNSDLSTPNNKVDLVVASNNGDEANTLVNNLKTRLGSAVDIQSAVMDSNNSIDNYDTETDLYITELKRISKTPSQLVLLNNGELYSQSNTLVNGNYPYILGQTGVKNIVSLGQQNQYWSTDEDGNNTGKSIDYTTKVDVILKNNGEVWYKNLTYNTFGNIIFKSTYKVGDYCRIDNISDVKEIGLAVNYTNKAELDTTDVLMLLKTDGTLYRYDYTTKSHVVVASGVKQLKDNYYIRADGKLIEMLNGVKDTGIITSGIKATSPYISSRVCALTVEGNFVSDEQDINSWNYTLKYQNDVSKILIVDYNGLALSKTNGDLVYYSAGSTYSYTSEIPSIIESGAYTSRTFKTHGSIRNVDSIHMKLDYYYNWPYSTTIYTLLIKYTDGSVSGSDNIADIYKDLYSGFGVVTFRNKTVETTAYYVKATFDLYKMTTWKTVNVPAFDTSILTNFNFRDEADKYFVYISSSDNKYWKNGIYSVFPFDSLNDSVINTFTAKGVAPYIVTTDAAMDLKLVPPYVDNEKQTKTIRDLYNSMPNTHGRFDSRVNVEDTIFNKYSSLIGKESNSVYLIYGEDSLAYSINYTDFETDPKYDLRWKFVHDPNYFETSLGLEPNSGIWQSKESDKFTKVGLYRLICSARDNPKNDDRFDDYRLWGEVSPTYKIYVHRRPIADFQIQLRKSGVGFSASTIDSSYDLDWYSFANRGIVSWRWKYRIVDGADWYYTQLPTYLDANKEYVVSLEVLDRQGIWSKPKVVNVNTYATNLTPTVDATPITHGWTNQDIHITVTADDNGENDFNRVNYTTSTDTVEPGWVGATMYQKVFPITYTAEGIWYLHMRVFDNVGNNSYKSRGPYLIDKTPPGGTAVPYEKYWTNQDVSMMFTPLDVLSGVNRWRYIASSSNGTSWGAWTGYAEGATSTTVTFNYEGLHKLMAEVIDNAGNVGYVTTGSYLIDKTPPVITPDITGPIEVFDKVTVNLALTDNLSGVKETRYCFTNSTDKPTGGWTTSTATNIAAAFDQEGEWYLHVECDDNAGNMSGLTLGTFKVIKLRLFDFTVSLMNDITWRDYYFNGVDKNEDGRSDEYIRKQNTDIMSIKMPINQNNGVRIIDYPREGIDAGCNVEFSIKSIGVPQNVMFIVSYLTKNGVKNASISPASVNNEVWYFSWNVPLECIEGSYISFHVRALKNGKEYGDEIWIDQWTSGNEDHKVFYIMGDVLQSLKFNQSH